MVIQGVYFYASQQTPVEWHHLVFNYIGTNGAQGMAIYHDGQEVVTNTNGHLFPTSTGPGEVVIGRYLTSWDGGYSSVLVDEMLFFNRELNLEEIRILYDAVKSDWRPDLKTTDFNL